MKKKESITTGQERVALHKKIKQYHFAYLHTTIWLRTADYFARQDTCDGGYFCHI